MLHEFFFLRFLRYNPKQGSYRLPTHRRRAHRNFFPLSIYVLNSEFLPNIAPGPHYASRG